MSRRKTINPDRARELRGAGLPWREIGKRLAIEAGRAVAYHPISVATAVRRIESQKLPYAGSERR